MYQNGIGTAVKITETTVKIIGTIAISFCISAQPGALKGRSLSGSVLRN